MRWRWRVISALRKIIEGRGEQLDEFERRIGALEERERQLGKADAVSDGDDGGGDLPVGDTDSPTPVWSHSRVAPAASTSLLLLLSNLFYSPRMLNPSLPA